MYETERRALDDEAELNSAMIEVIEDAERREYRRQLLKGASHRWVEQVCYHEAGHCVGYYATGAGVDAASLVIDEKQDRQHQVTGQARARRVVDAYARAQGSLAGIACERLAGFDAPERAQWTTNTDVLAARRALSQGGRLSTDADIEREIRAAEHLLRRHWPAVSALARELHHKTELTGDEAEAIITRALGAARAA